MAENRETIILDVQLDAKKVAKELGDATNQVRILKQEQKLLEKAFADGRISAVDYGKIIAQNKAELETAQRTVKSSTALLQAAEVQQVSENETLDQQRQKLNTLQKAYANMTEEQKNATVNGQTLTERIDALSESVKKQEAAIGDNRRNVGAYTKSILEASAQMGGLGKATQDIISPIKNATAGLKAMSATPVIAVLNVLVTILAKLAERFKGNAAAMEQLNRLFGAFEGVGQIVNKIIDKLAAGVGWLADRMLDLADRIGLVTDEMRESQRIAEEELAMNAKQRDAAKKNAEDLRDISELRAKANEKDKVGTQDRLKLLQQAADKEEAIAKRNATLAEEAYKLQVAKNAQSESSQEDLKTENDLYIAMINAQTAYMQKQRELAGQMSSIREQQANEAKQAAAVRLEIERKLQDTLVELDTDAVSRQINQTRIAGEREVDNLKIKLDNLKKADTKARDELQALIIAREKQTQEQIDAIAIRAAEQRAETIRKNAYTAQELLTTDTLQIAQFREESTRTEYEHLLNLTEQEQRVLYSSREEYETTLIAKQKEYADAQIAVQKELYERRQIMEENEYARQLQNIESGDAVALAEAELARAQEQHDALVEMDDATKAMLYTSQEAYESAVIASENRIIDAKRRALEETKKMAIANANAIGSVLGSVSSLLDQFGEKNKAAAKASKIIALGKIAIETGVAIASGTAQAQSVPFPANIAAIATTVATVLANMGSAIAAVRSANFDQSDAGNFSEGGRVKGSNTTGDKLIAHVNADELITNPKQTANLLYEVAQNPARGGFDYDRLAKMIANANRELPAPVLVYSEFEDFENKQVQIENYATI